jgi:hypothetical protein
MVLMPLSGKEIFLIMKKLLEGGVYNERENPGDRYSKKLENN